MKRKDARQGPAESGYGVLAYAKDGQVIVFLKAYMGINRFGARTKRQHLCMVILRARHMCDTCHWVNSVRNGSHWH